METQAQPITKKKLCRVSKGFGNSRTLLMLNGTREAKDRESSSGERTLVESVAREIGGAQLVEISVVRGNRTDGETTTMNDEGKDTDQGGDFGSDCRLEKIQSEQDVPERDERQHARKVAFSDDITIHSFECDEDAFSDVEDDILSEEFEDIPLNETDPCSSKTYNDPVVQTPQASVPKKIPLRQVMLRHVTRRASLLKSFLTGSFRKPATNYHAKTQVSRTRSLQDASVRHSFIKAEDKSVQLVIPLGQQYVADTVSVTTSGNGRKIKVSASRKRSHNETVTDYDFKGDYHEWFYMPQAIEPRQTKAAVDQEGWLKIEAPFAGMAKN